MIREAEPRPVLRRGRSSLRDDITEGLRYVVRDKPIRALIASNAIMSFMLAGLNAIWLLYVLDVLHWSPAVTGLVSTSEGPGDCGAPAAHCRRSRNAGHAASVLMASTNRPASGMERTTSSNSPPELARSSSRCTPGRLRLADTNWRGPP